MLLANPAPLQIAGLRTHLPAYSSAVRSHDCGCPECPSNDNCALQAPADRSTYRLERIRACVRILQILYAQNATALQLLSFILGSAQVDVNLYRLPMSSPALSDWLVGCSSSPALLAEAT